MADLIFAMLALLYEQGDSGGSNPPGACSFLAITCIKLRVTELHHKATLPVLFLHYGLL